MDHESNEVDAAALREAFLARFDEAFRDDGDPSYKEKRRESLVAILDAFVAACSG